MIDPQRAIRALRVEMRDFKRDQMGAIEGSKDFVRGVVRGLVIALNAIKRLAIDSKRQR